MIKELKYVSFVLVIFFFYFFSTKYYFSNENIKNSYRSIDNIDLNINNYGDNLIILKNNTEVIIDYVENDTKEKKKKYYFWKLIKNDD
tara:strand:+ start:3719 stop:3982 length:264 start_codon:yes stop_codon:yes gene_type:complete